MTDGYITTLSPSLSPTHGTANWPPETHRGVCAARHKASVTENRNKLQQNRTEQNRHRLPLYVPPLNDPVMSQNGSPVTTLYESEATVPRKQLSPEQKQAIREVSAIVTRLLAHDWDGALPGANLQAQIEDWFQDLIESLPSGGRHRLPRLALETSHRSLALSATSAPRALPRRTPSAGGCRSRMERRQCWPVLAGRTQVRNLTGLERRPGTGAKRGARPGCEEHDGIVDRDALERYTDRIVSLRADRKEINETIRAPFKEGKMPGLRRT